MPAKKITADDVMSRVFKSARAEKGLTQAKIAKRLSMTQTAVSRWERQFGTMNAEQIVAYCKISSGRTPKKSLRSTAKKGV